VPLLVLFALIASSCRVSPEDVAADQIGQQSEISSQPSLEPSDPAARPASPPDNLPRALSVADLTCDVPATNGRSTGLTGTGEAIYDRYVASSPAVPSYQLAIDVDPATGQVAGAMRARVPSDNDQLHFRAFAGMDAFESGLSINNVRVDGSRADATLDRALLTVPTSSADGPLATVELDFAFTIDQMAANQNLFGAISGETLQPDQVGLLGRTDTGMQLGHWFPVWLPDGVRTDPDPSGFGDIGAFPTANICATITVPAEYRVVTGGSLVSATDSSTTEAGTGLRDFAMLISNDLEIVEGQVDGVAVRVWGPSGDPESLATVLDYAVRSQRALVAAFGPYPWTEVDLVSAPLGGGVGGMEWPGMIWIEQSMFGGGLPGMGQFGDVLGDSDMDLSTILGSWGGPALTTTLEWTIAHELGHEWWHALVGNDSIASPAVDEPLAQFAACIAMIDIHPDNWREICEAQTTGQYAQARALGIHDTAAEQPSDAFESAIQYGAIVYGKAPGFYFEAADLLGWDELVAALGSFIAENSFALVSTDELRQHLIEAAGADGPAIGALWDRWLRESKGDEDIEPVDLFGAFGDIDGLDLENFDLENFDIEGFDPESFDDLFGENSDLFNELLEGLLEDSAN